MDRYQQALNELYYSLTNLKPDKFPGELGLLRTQYCLKLLGNPEKSFAVIHIAGTSGKGSTAYTLANLLSTHGKATGLFLSPHIVDIRERISVDGKVINPLNFTKIYYELKNVADKVKRETTLGQLTFFEMLALIALVFFKRSKVSYAVLETGLGGAWDATNVIQDKNKVSIISRIGFDHTHILGKSLTKIAGQKSGIISRHSRVFALKQKDNVMQIIAATAMDQNAQLVVVPKLRALDGDLSFIWKRFPEITLKTGLYGVHQLENTALALSCLEYLSKRDEFKLDPDKIKTTLLQTKLLGRFSLFKTPAFLHPLILDGAHNPQKIGAFVKALELKYPNKKIVFIVAYKRNKDVMSCLKKLVPIAKHIYLTTYIDKDDKMQPPAFDPFELGNMLIKLKFHNFTIAKDPKLAFMNAKDNFRREIVTVTGSMYLLSRIIKLL